MQKAEIVIIGGGVVGASVAYHLTNRGCRDVLIVERESEPGQGSTGKATGGVRAQFETEINIKLSLYSLDFFRDWDFECGYEPRGYLFLATDDKQMEFLSRSGKRQRNLGYHEVEIVDNRTIAEMVPGINCTDIVGGSFGPRDGFIDPLAVLDGLLSTAVSKGARVETANNVRSILVRSGSVSGVATSNGIIECENVVVCSGVWSRELAATAGVELPVEPQRRQIVWAKVDSELSPALPMVIDLSSGFHFRTARNVADEILFAYPDSDNISGFSTDFDETFIGKVYEKVRHRAPFLAEAKVVREKCRAGLYENTPDHHAILGGCEIEGLYFGCGFSGHGVMHSPATGMVLAEIIIDGKAGSLDVSSLSLDRFKSGKMLRETAFI